jgi:hypothetical protein
MSAPNASCIINELLSRWRLVTKVLGLGLLQGRPGYTRLMALERQLRCGKCGARGRASLEVGISAAGLSIKHFPLAAEIPAQCALNSQWR